MTIQEVKNNFVQNLAENAYINMCSVEEMNIVIKALEKQIPKKLKITEVGRFGAVLLCPSCENEIAMIYNSVWQKGKYKQKYCDNCGQALDWSSDVEE